MSNSLFISVVFFSHFSDVEDETPTKEFRSVHFCVTAENLAEARAKAHAYVIETRDRAEIIEIHTNPHDEDIIQLESIKLANPEE
jgi:hypothetical protein